MLRLSVVLEQSGSAFPVFKCASSGRFRHSSGRPRLHRSGPMKALFESCCEWHLLHPLHAQKAAYSRRGLVFSLSRGLSSPHLLRLVPERWWEWQQFGSTKSLSCGDNFLFREEWNGSFWKPQICRYHCVYSPMKEKAVKSSRTCWKESQLSERILKLFNKLSFSHNPPVLSLFTAVFMSDGAEGWR